MLTIQEASNFSCVSKGIAVLTLSVIENTETEIAIDNTKHRSLLIQNRSGLDVYLGPSGLNLDAADNIRLADNEIFQINLAPNNSIYCFCPNSIALNILEGYF